MSDERPPTSQRFKVVYREPESRRTLPPDEAAEAWYLHRATELIRAFHEEARREATDGPAEVETEADD